MDHQLFEGTEEESSDRHSSEEDGETEGEGEGSGAEGAWAISDAQAQHYAAQFAQLRPDRGLLSGHTARLFFEKSRLSMADLRKIWQLADLNKDGMLSLDEFSIAMHLIVLRRSGAPVPRALPAALARAAPPTELRDLAADMNANPRFPPPKADAQLNNKEWTKFVDSPTSSVSSPGPKPVNFDFHKSALERDPKIFHPVALRVTPDAAADGERRSPRRDDFAHAFEPPSPKRAEPNGPQEIKSIQRPQPKKPPKNAGALPPPPARDHEDAPAAAPRKDEAPATILPRKDAPPPPPPRPLRQHARSSSLDLNRFKGAPAPPPQPPPRMSPPGDAPRRLTNQRSEPEPAFAPRDIDPDGFPYTRDDAPKMHGAFEVYRKPSREGSAGEEPTVRALQEQNAVLHRVCRALVAELADVAREREQLRARLLPRDASV
ncbi:hypothetical protein MSG28_013114 [Choristoneura fumiferana]|uniref:Uncharacterized protein n=1 Tax=Choristoneura fumiferana TaxID=7141 RepID=A0ACC0KSV9_CHOFU|nr:hypothetical protein MSG28_013114 [Choristoneura fumiferana]